MLITGAALITFILGRKAMTTAKNETAYQGGGGLLPRGLRNNNPGNIRRTADKWLGLQPVQNDADFFQFTDPVYGIRAMSRILSKYQARGLTTVEEIISTWAPSSENNTTAYVNYIAQALGVLPWEPINLQEHKPQLIAAIIRYENGINPYDASTIQDGIRLSGSYA
jgi:hypothetical protein